MTDFTGIGKVFALVDKKIKKAGERILRPDLFERLAATYSRGSYTTTTIGKTVFDGRVRNGNGSGHCFMTTKIIEASEKANLFSSNFRHCQILKDHARNSPAIL